MRGTVIAAVVVAVLGILGGIGAAFFFTTAEKVASGDPEAMFEAMEDIAGEDLQFTVSFDGPGGPLCSAAAGAISAAVTGDRAARQRITAALARPAREPDLRAKLDRLDLYSSRRQCDRFADEAETLVALLGLEMPAYERPPPAAAPRDGERILAYRTEILLRRDRSLLVTETIRLVAQGKQIKGGIYRDLANAYRDHQGRSFKVAFTVDDARRNGEPTPHQVQAGSNVDRLILGRSDLTLKPGTYEYAVSYHVRNRSGSFARDGEFFWPVTGKWAFAIEQASVAIGAEAGAMPGDGRLYVEGVEAPADAVATRLTPEGRIELELLRALAPYEDLSIVAAVPEEG